MQLILLLISCLMTLITSLTVSTNLFLQYLELRLMLMGQIVTVINLFLRGESLWTLSPNILGSFAICLMDLYQNTVPNVDDEPDLFFILPLGFLIISLLLVQEEKFTRGFFNNTSTSDEPDFEFKFLPHFRPDLFTLVDPYTMETFNTYSLVALHGQYLYHDSESEDTEDSEDEVLDSDLDEVEVDNEVEDPLQVQLEEVLAPHVQALVLEMEDPPNEQLQGVLPPHIQALVLEIFPPGLPFLAMPG